MADDSNNDSSKKGGAGRKRKEAQAGPSSETSAKKPKSTEELVKLQKFINEDLLTITENVSMYFLVNIIEYDDRFVATAREVFKTKFCDKTVNVSTASGEQAAKLLNLFGDLITQLKVIYDKSFRRFAKFVDAAIISKCRQPLLTIEFVNAQPHTLKKLTEPFENVNSVIFTGDAICGLVADFSKWFPKARALELLRLGAKDGAKKALLKHIPHLEHFGISTNRKPRKSNYSGLMNNGDILDFIKLNPQLKSLKIVNDDLTPDQAYGLNGTDTYSGFYGIHIDGGDLWNFERILPDLEKLHLGLKVMFYKGMLYCHNGMSYGHGPIQFKKLKELVVECACSGIVYKLLIASDQLETLSLIESCPDDEPALGWCDRIILENNSNAKIIKLRGNWILRIANRMLNVAPKLKNLEEFHFSYPTDMKMEQIVELLTKCERLQKVVVNSGYVTQKQCKVIGELFKSITGMIGTEWKANVQQISHGFDFDFGFVSVECQLSLEKNTTKAVVDSESK